jgi:putative transposase
MRKNRVLKDGADYHVSVKINRGEMLLKPTATKDLFLAVIARAKKKYNFHIKNFCLMDNHVHLIIHPGKGASLSKIMQWILSVFARLWNMAHNLSGHVWGERFFSRIIAGILDMVRMYWYLDENPVRAGLVGAPWNWKYGGLWHHRHRERSIQEEPESIIPLFIPHWA